MEIRAIEGTPNSVGDAPVLPRLHGQIDPHEALLSIIGDGAYGIEACNEVIALRQPRRSGSAEAVITGAAWSRPRWGA
jgi:hypothetical protein